MKNNIRAHELLIINYGCNRNTLMLFKNANLSSWCGPKFEEDSKYWASISGWCGYCRIKSSENLGINNALLRLHIAHWDCE